MKTRVVFFIETAPEMHEDAEREVFAFFPDEQWNLAGDNVSYAHVGQHGPCSAEYCIECDAATPEEYAKLYKELTELVGYDLHVMTAEEFNKEWIG